MPKPLQLVGQAIAYLAFAAFIGYLSLSPPYQYGEPGTALISLIFSHPTKRVDECRKLSPEEIMKLPPNMRTATECARERNLLLVELVLDDILLHSGHEIPTGIWSDGPANVYKKFAVPPGQHRLVVRMNGSGKTQEFDFIYSGDIELQENQNFLIGFDRIKGFQILGQYIQPE